jgi:hypothetical protein
VTLLVDKTSGQVTQGWVAVVPVKKGKENIDREFLGNPLQCVHNRHIPPTKRLRRQLVLVVRMIESVVEVVGWTGSLVLLYPLLKNITNRLNGILVWRQLSLGCFAIGRTTRGRLA